MSNYHMGMDGFVWFTGVVEDRNDPAKLGRVRVRCLGLHTENKYNIPTSALPWAHVMHPVTDPSMQGMGMTPSFLIEGAWVVGFFRDAVEMQQPVVMGSLPGYNQLPDDIGDDTSTEGLKKYREEHTNRGFNDPNFVYPQYPNEKSGHTLGESDVNRLARGDNNFMHKMLEEKRLASENFNGVQTSQSGNFEMPYENTTNYSTYPYNHVFESESGHIKEYDDTPNEERIHEYHRAGTYYEVDAGGNKIVHVVGDNYEFIAGSNFVNVKGNVNLTIDGNAETYITDNYNIRCKNLNLEVEKDFDTFVGGKTTERYEGTFKTTALSAVSQRFNTTTDFVFTGGVTQVYGSSVYTSVTGAVSEVYGSTLDCSVVGLKSEITAAGLNLSSQGAVIINGSTINLNDGDKGAARLDDAAVGTDTAGLGAGTVNSVITSASSTVFIGTAAPSVGASSLSATTIPATDVDPADRTNSQGSESTENAGTGDYNPGVDGGVPIPAIPVRATAADITSEVGAAGVDTAGLSSSQQRQAHKDTVTDTLADYYPDDYDDFDPAGKEQINKDGDPTSFESGEKLPPVTAGTEDTNQNQYRSYLGVPTAGKTFGDLFDESEITDNIRGRYTNKYFPSDYRIPQLRGLPRLKIKLNAGVTLTGTSPKVLEIAEKIAFDLGKQLTINSAYRSGEANRRCGGASGSKHLEGLALDVRTVGYTNSEKVEYVRLAIEHGALAFGFYNRFIHFDIHSKRNWGSIPSRYRATLKAGKISPYKNG